jgi:hypothetical protein
MTNLGMVIDEIAKFMYEHLSEVVKEEPVKSKLKELTDGLTVDNLITSDYQFLIDETKRLHNEQYTDEEINTLFRFTDEEIKLMDDTLKKFGRNSPWFKRYKCGKESQDETTVPEPIVFEVSDFDDTLEDIKSMDDDTLIHEYRAWYSAWEVETNSGETDCTFRVWLKEQFEEQKMLAEEMEED